MFCSNSYFRTIRLQLRSAFKPLKVFFGLIILFRLSTGSCNFFAQSVSVFQMLKQIFSRPKSRISSVSKMKKVWHWIQKIVQNNFQDLIWPVWPKYTRNVLGSIFEPKGQIIYKNGQINYDRQKQLKKFILLLRWRKYF